MNEVECLDLRTMKTFTKVFDSPYKARVFVLRCKHSKKLRVIGFTYHSQEEYEYIGGY